MYKEDELLLGTERDVSTVTKCLNQLSEIEVKRILLSYLTPAAFGIASATLFWPASKGEINTESGKWLAEHLGIRSPYLYFFSAAPDLFMLAYFFGRNFTSIFKKAYREQPTLSRKILLVVSVGLLATYQSMQTIAITYGAGGGLINILLATAGQLPNSAWSAVNIITEGTKKAYELIHRFKLAFYKRVIRHISGEVIDYEMQIQAEQLIKVLQERVMAGFKRHDFKKVRFDRGLSTIQVLQGLTENLPAGEVSSGSWYGGALRVGLQGIGFIMASLLFLGVMLNFKNFLRNFLGELVAAWIFGLLLCVGSIYTFNTINVGAGGQVYDYLNAKINGHNYLSSTYNLYPTFTLFIVAFAAIWSLISYPTIKALLSKNYHWLASNEVVIGGCVSSVSFHVAGDVKCYSLAAGDVAKHKPTPEAESTFRVHDVLAELENNPKRVLAEVAGAEVSRGTRKLILGEVAESELQALIEYGFFRVRRRVEVPLMPVVAQLQAQVQVTHEPSAPELQVP